MPGKNRRVLIVDDRREIHEDFRKILREPAPSELDQIEEALFGEGATGDEPLDVFELDSAWQGEEGVEMVRRALVEERPYALAFVDMRMPPGWDGLQTIEKIFECDPRIQVVICTAYSDSSWLEIRRRFGPTDRLLILKKPFDIAEVCQLACAMTEKWHLTEQAWRQARRAHYDPLTGLPNRTLLAELFRHGVERAERHAGMLGFFYIDLDQFKLVNDSFGHATGDAMLQEVARRLLSAVGGNQELARVGGDEFVLLANLNTTEAASELAQNLLAALAPAIDAGGFRVYSSASIGISLYPLDGGSFEELAHNADAAMYESKRGLPNGFQFFNHEIGDRARGRLQMQTLVRGALDRNEFVLYYQPVYGLSDLSITGSEALIRWDDPARGILSPQAFIPIAEDIGCMAKIEEWVFEEACRQTRAWEKEGGDPFRVAVNISATRFSSNDLIPRIMDALDRTEANPALLDLELTETVLVRDLEKASETMRALRALGLRVSIDDFGTGYSSFSYLASLPFNTLKIDKSFLCGIQMDYRRALVLEAIVTLAHKLGITVVAEGIEDAGQLNAVRSVGCDHAQGYLLGRPELPGRLDRAKRLSILAGDSMSADLHSVIRHTRSAPDGEHTRRDSNAPALH
jgi:diguanylate cyclase (GGDEF)-like protein